MRILVVSATRAEVGPFVSGLRRTVDETSNVTGYAANGHHVDVLVTGVGMVATATWVSRTFAHVRYDLALNLGVCGSFDRALVPGTVVHVVSDRLAELGAEDGDAFLTIHEMQLLDENAPPFTQGQLVNAAPPVNHVLAGLPSVAGITVSTVHGNEQSIACVTRRCAPQVESMEGAAFMYACLVHAIPFAQVRGVSNLVERRNRNAWTLPEAIAALGDTALRIVDHL